MKSMSLAPVLNNATHNRQTLAVKEFRTPDSVDTVERFYWRKWEAPVPSVVAPWKQLSKMIAVVAGRVFYCQASMLLV